MVLSLRFLPRASFPVTVSLMYASRFSSLRMVALLLGASILLSACTNSAGTTVESDKNYDYTQFVSSLLVVDQFSSEYEEIGAGLTERMRARMEEHGRSISFMQVESEKVSLGEDTSLLERALEKARETGANQVLILSDPETDVDIGGGATGVGPDGMPIGFGPTNTVYYKFSGHLYDVKTEERVWVAEVTTNQQAPGEQRFGRGIGDDLLKAMIDDALLPSFMRLPEKERVTR